MLYINNVQNGFHKHLWKLMCGDIGWQYLVIILHSVVSKMDVCRCLYCGEEVKINWISTICEHLSFSFRISIYTGNVHLYFLNYTNSRIYECRMCLWNMNSPAAIYDKIIDLGVKCCIWKRYHQLSMHATYEVCISCSSRVMAKVTVFPQNNRRKNRCP